MIGSIGQTLPLPVTYWLMMVLLLLFLGALALAWMLGRMLGPRSGWRKRWDADREHRRKDQAASDVDPWTEAARRLREEPQDPDAEEGEAHDEPDR